MTRIPAALALASLAWLWASGAALGQSLEDVVDSVLRHGPAIRYEDERVRRALGQLQQAEGAFDWNATAEAGWERLYVPEDRNGFLTTDLLEVDAWRTTVGMSKRFRSGIEVQPGVTFYSDVDATEAQTFGVTRPRPSLNMTLPLLRGSGSNNMAAANERAAQGILDGTRRNREFGIQRALHDAVQTYWRCLAAAQHVAILSEAQSEADAYASSLRTQASSGQIEQTALDRVIANQAAQAVALRQAQDAERQCRTDLAALTGAPAGSPLPELEGAFPDSSGLAQVASRWNEAAMTEEALARREDVKALARYDAAQTERVHGAEDASQPQVDLYLDTTKVLVRVTKSLNGTAEDGRLTEAVAAAAEARLNRDQLEARVRGEVGSQIGAVRAALANNETLEEAARLMEGVAADAARREQAGLMSRQDYQTARDEWTRIRRAAVDARLQLASSIAGLRLATGTIAFMEAPVSMAAAFRTLP